MLYLISFSSDETSNEAVKEQGGLSTPLDGCSTTSQDVESSPGSTSTNENSPLPSNESTSITPQASPSSVPADGGETPGRKMGKLPVFVQVYGLGCPVLVPHVFMTAVHTSAAHHEALCKGICRLVCLRCLSHCLRSLSVMVFPSA
jgi:hypothetical protein